MRQKSIFISFCFFLFSGSLMAQQEQINRLPVWAMGGFERPSGINPVIVSDSTTSFFDPMHQKMIHWEANDTFNPAAIVKKGKIVVLYRAEDKSGVGIGKRTSRIGYAESNDGLHFKRRTTPVLFPADDNAKKWEWPGGCEDPRVAVTVNGRYVMLYTEWNRKVPRLGVATSTDLIHWKKYGPAFLNAYKGKYANMATKSAAILTKIKDGKQIICQINNTYWMYWGEQHVYAATSTNLTDWTPLQNSDGSLKILASPRPGHFDSQLTECGPPAILTKKGILLLYNGKNAPGKQGDPRFGGGAYSAGQMLFSAKNPTQLINRLNVPFFRPMEPFEKTGQYVDGTVFVEGMAYFKQQWFIYYGCADSRVGVAVYNPGISAPADPVPEKQDY